ncbi:MAG: hypothetical protein M1820_003652 [Bogoriella megaspora]|nr:MAG: hypothetical protein M1820_003652 [Bogoriella megaspora]
MFSIAAPLVLTSPKLTVHASSPSIDKDLVSYSDINLLEFSLYLANFQSAFYRQGLANFTKSDFSAANFSADFYTQLTTIAFNAQTHVTSFAATLKDLNASTVAECTYDFNVTTPLGFVTTAGLIQGVAVSAYVGSLSTYKSTALQTVAASILAVESRHSSYIRDAVGQQPFASPFETPLDLNEAYTLAELFTPECPPSNPDFKTRTLPLDSGKAPENSTLSSSFSNHGVVGGNVTLLTFGYNVRPANGSTQVYAAFLTITGPVFAPATPVPGLGFNVTVPSAPKGYVPINGFTYVVLTSSKTTLRDEDILAGPATLEIYLE